MTDAIKAEAMTADWLNILCDKLENAKPGDAVLLKDGTVKKKLIAFLRQQAALLDQQSPTSLQNTQTSPSPDNVREKVRAYFVEYGILVIGYARDGKPETPPDLEPYIRKVTALFTPDNVQDLHKTPPVGEDVREAAGKLQKLVERGFIAGFNNGNENFLLHHTEDAIAKHEARRAGSWASWSAFNLPDTDRILSLIPGRKAKALEWERLDSAVLIAKTGLGNYKIISAEPDRHEWQAPADFPYQTGAEETLEAAKEAAEAHWQDAYAKGAE